MDAYKTKADGGGQSAFQNNYANPNSTSSVSGPQDWRRRLPAYGRQLKAALDHGMRPIKGGGTIIVTTEWHYARYFDPARVVCPPDDSADGFDFTFLNGCEVIVLVHERHEPLGRALRDRIKHAGAKIAVLLVNREVATC